MIEQTAVESQARYIDGEYSMAAMQLGCGDAVEERRLFRIAGCPRGCWI